MVNFAPIVALVLKFALPTQFPLNNHRKINTESLLELAGFFFD
jgi:hypothetical protein